MGNKRELGAVLGAIAALVLASACGGDASKKNEGVPDGGPLPEGETFTDEDTFACTTPLPDVTAGIHPAVPVDYIEIREQLFHASHPLPQPDPFDFDAGPIADAGPKETGPSSDPPRTIDRSGAACKGASSPAACESALAAAALADARDGWNPHFDGTNSIPDDVNRQFVVYTRGDEVGTLRTASDVRAFLGTIDSFEEVRLLLRPMGVDFTCTTDPRKSGWRKNPDGSFEVLASGYGCGPYRLRYRIEADGTVTPMGSEQIGQPLVCGRRPASLDEPLAGGEARGLADYFAEVAYLEAASVLAFRQLERELRDLGAPERLVARARQSQADEIRHARDTARMARRFGATPRAVHVDEAAARPVFEIARENAIEGCVRETFGALVAAYQSRAAEDPEVRALFAAIAIEEARHAELARDVALFLDAHLDAADRARIASAKDRAFRELRVSLARGPSRDVARVAGLPTAPVARELLEHLERELVAAA